MAERKTEEPPENFRWNAESDAKLRELAENHTASEIASQLERRIPSVYLRARELGVVCRKSPDVTLHRKKKYAHVRTPQGHTRWTDLDIETLGELYGEVPAKEIAARLGRSISAVYSQAAMLGLARIN